MRKINSSYITSTALQPFKQGTWTHLQGAYQDVAAALAQHLANGTNLSGGFGVLYGCNLADDGTNYTVTEGAIYYNGEIYLVDAVGTTVNPSGGNTRICKIVTTYLTAANADPVAFTDGSTNNVHEIRKVVIENGTNATSGYIGEFEDLQRTCAFNATQLDVASTGSTYTLSFNFNRTIDFAAFTSGVVQLEYDFNNAAIGCTQRISATMANADQLAALYDTFIILEICEGSTLTRVTGASAYQTLKTASGSESIVVELTYLGFTSSSHKIGIKIWS